MKFAFVFLLLLEVHHSNGQQEIEMSGQVLLRLLFPSLYNGNDKSCCRLYPGGCYKVMDSRGYACDFVKGRVTKIENDGWIEFKIWDAQLVDAGYYRCSVHGTENHIYKDYLVEISESTDHHSLPLPSLKTTIRPFKTTKAPLDTTGPSLVKDHSDHLSVPWSLGLPLAVAVSIVMLIFIIPVIILVCHRLKAKNKRGELLCDSSKHQVPEVSSVVYTTVDFKPHQEPTELYANLFMHSPRALRDPNTNLFMHSPRALRDPNTNGGREHAGTVEYSTLAISQ